MFVNYYYSHRQIAQGATLEDAIALCRDCAQRYGSEIAQLASEGDGHGCEFCGAAQAAEPRRRKLRRGRLRRFVSSAV